MKCPALIRAIEDDLEAGRAAVIQLVSTGEALMERRIAEIPASEWDDLTIDLTPRDGILSFLMHAFPVQLQEPFTDGGGNLMSRPVVDAGGNPVICREAGPRRDALIEKLAALPPVLAALDRIVQHFGHEAVAEVTGRSRRVLRIADGQGERLALRPRPAGAGLARRPGDPGPRAHPPHASGLRAAVPPRHHRRQGRAPFHRHHRPASRFPRRHHPRPARQPDRHGRRRYGAVPRERQSGERLRQGAASPVLPAPSRTLDDSGLQERVRLLRPAVRETMARAELDASAWRRAGEAAWRAAWDAETTGLPSHRDSRFWLATGLLLPVWDRLPAETMRVRRLTAAAGGIALIGRVLDAGKVRDVRAAFGLAGGPAMTGAEAFEAVMDRGTALPLANGWRIARHRIMGAARVEIEGPADTDVPALKRLGCTVEIVSWRARVFAPDARVLERILERRPLAA